MIYVSVFAEMLLIYYTYTHARGMDYSFQFHETDTVKV